MTTTRTPHSTAAQALPDFPPVLDQPLPGLVPPANVDDADGDADGGADEADGEEEPGFEDDELGFEGGGFSPTELEEFDESDFDDDFDDDFEEDLDDDLDDKDEPTPAADDDEDDFDDEELSLSESSPETRKRAALRRGNDVPVCSE